MNAKETGQRAEKEKGRRKKRKKKYIKEKRVTSRDGVKERRKKQEIDDTGKG